MLPALVVAGDHHTANRQADGLHQDSDARTVADGAGHRAAMSTGAIPLFQADGTNAPALAERLRLAADYAAAAQHTQAFYRLLTELKLLQPIRVQPGGTARTGELARLGNVIHGLLAVSDSALAALSDAAFLRLRADGHLGAMYTHLVSLRAIERMPD